MKRWEIINALVERFAMSTYLEIGIWMGECISKINAQLRYGVDPGDKPTIVEDCVGKWSPTKRQLIADPKVYFPSDPIRDKLFLETSNDFFFLLEDYFDEGKALSSYDFIFIDGCHTQVQSMVDFVNAERVLSDGGVIMLHDTLPPHQKNAREDGMDNGEVWKTVAILRCTRPDLEIVTVNTDAGCTLIRPAVPRMAVLYREAPLSTCLTWEYFEKHKSKLLNIIDVNEFPAHLKSMDPHSFSRHVDDGGDG